MKLSENKDKLDYEVLTEGSIDDDKYDRQKRIVGWDQSKISNAKVMVVGAGATGNELVKNLVLTGIGKIILIDYDTINLSNLNRCVLFDIKSAKKQDYKVDVVKKACKNLSPETEIIALKEDLNDVDNKIYQEANVICSCVDNIEARLQANNYAYYYEKPFIDSGIDDFYGTVQAVYSKVKDAACLQCGITGMDLDLMWKKYSCTGQEIETVNGETIGKMATIITTTAIIGGIQAHQVIKFILGLEDFTKFGKWNSDIGNPLIGKQLNYNGLTNTFDIITKIKNDECWVCSYKKKNKK
ncbi:MAG: ThiF family adenylyltransferase [Promethearchaeota archaeon]|nr:MAG: ThiF family adenylyltransferase [Candidatus Lokiarchaeota archaeon]